MAAVSVKADQLLFEAGSPVNELFLILKGSFSISLPDGTYTLSQGDVIGICELQAASHRTACRALEDSTVLSYQISDMDSLDALFKSDPSYTAIFIRSAIKQMGIIMDLVGQQTYDPADLPASDTAYEAVSTGSDGADTDAACTGAAGANADVSSDTACAPPDTGAGAVGAASVPAACGDPAASTPASPGDPDILKQEASAAGAEAILSQTAGSLKTILEYARAEKDFCLQFVRSVTQYRDIADKSAADDPTRRLRAEITAQFYELYRLVFFRAVEDGAPPLPVRMFLFFGFVDEQLAGADNTVFLGQTAERLAGSSHPHIYTMYDWLAAIYSGSREPSRNEFDQDYTDYLHKQRVTGKISAAEEAALSSDMRKKVDYELKNMFPSVNKMTFGRISVFCPVFSADNVLKSTDSTLVTADSLKKTLHAVIGFDYSAFYREYLYTNQAAGIPKESFHTEVLPDMILMPVAGTRGVMWQEVEGRRRTTPARMMLPIFYPEDLYAAVARLVGEYRWEMCKRVQGGRWNDVSDPSLTSEYFDYIQFYRKSHELSADTKERIKNALQKAHGSFKEMFVRDYVTYILYESAGSPRLTKPARTILFHYCPFAKQTRDALMGNPLYKEILDRYEIWKKQRLYKLGLLEKRLMNTGAALPEELTAELRFYES